MTSRFPGAYTLLSVALCCLVGCGGDDAPPDASTSDGGADGGSATCVTATDCDDGSFCAGRGTCSPGAAGADARGCVFEVPCLATQVCNETMRACLSDCAMAPDADADGYTAVSCGGTDCDDADATRFPGNAEVCDAAGHDEDCNPTTLAGIDGDRDGDGFVAAACCFLTPGGSLQCGTDCDDAEFGVHPGAIEVCNGQDDDCNGALDGPGEDADRDGFANDMCAGAAGADCDDADPNAHVGATELCNGRDDDCMIAGVRRRAGEPGAELSEDVDGDRHSAPSATCSATAPAGVTLFAKDDCDDARASTYGGARELCNGVDDDCNGVSDDRAGGAVGSACLPLHIGVGGQHSCVIEDDGTLDCFGDNSCGQLGDSAAPPGLVVHTVLPSPAVEVDGGGNYTCALSMDGAVTCFGFDGLLRARSSPFSSPRCGAIGPVALDGPATALTTGSAHACAIVGGLVKCWGFSAFHALDPAVAGTVDEWFAPAIVGGLSGVTQIDAGSGRTCAVHSGGAVRCWGANFAGELGVAANIHTFDVPITDATKVAVGSTFACALRTAGTVACWGVNEAGVLGCGTTPGCPPIGSGAASTTGTPVSVTGLTDVVDLQAGSGRSACARTASGGIRCWGANDFDQLGDDSYTSGSGPVATDSPIPVAALNTDGAMELAVGGSHACVMTADHVRCFGRGTERQLGDGQVTHNEPWDRNPRRISVFAFAVHTALSASASCFITPAGDVRCAGDNVFGELGSSGSAFASYPTRAFGAGPFASFAVRAEASIRADAAGSVVTSGRRGYGPFAFPGTVGVAAGTTHYCSHTAAGALSCWGTNMDGQVGDGTATRFVDTASMVTIADPVLEVVAGDSFTCARTVNETLCWGRGTAGQLGSLPVGVESRPRAITTLPALSVDLSAGDDSACAALASGAVACWGAALGPFAASNTPTVVAGIVGEAVQVAVGASSACARTADGHLFCWGDGANGRLGNGATTGSPTALAVEYVTDATDIACGSAHCCAARACGQSVCWGRAGVWMPTGGDFVAGDSRRPIGVAGMYTF